MGDRGRSGLEGTAQQGVSWSVLITKCDGGQMKDDVMGGACGMYGGRRRVYTLWFGNLREADHLEDLGVDGRIILK